MDNNQFIELCPGIQVTPTRFGAYHAHFDGKLIYARLRYEKYFDNESRKKDPDIIPWKEWLVSHYRKMIVSC